MANGRRCPSRARRPTSGDPPEGGFLHHVPTHNPTYGYAEVSIYNICGADIMGSTAAHGKRHMLASEGSRHHSEARDTVTGYETVRHDAEGHWERADLGGHWG